MGQQHRCWKLGSCGWWHRHESGCCISRVAGWQWFGQNGQHGVTVNAGELHQRIHIPCAQFLLRGQSALRRRKVTRYACSIHLGRESCTRFFLKQIKRLLAGNYFFPVYLHSVRAGAPIYHRIRHLHGKGKFGAFSIGGACIQPALRCLYRRPHAPPQIKFPAERWANGTSTAITDNGARCTYAAICATITTVYACVIFTYIAAGGNRWKIIRPVEPDLAARFINACQRFVQGGVMGERGFNKLVNCRVVQFRPPGGCGDRRAYLRLISGTPLVRGGLKLELCNLAATSSR